MKTQIQKLKSSKLFYNKWPYKVECTVFGAYIVGRFKLPHVKAWCNGDNSFCSGTYGSKNINRANLLVFVEAVEDFLSNDQVQIRTEGSRFNLFCKEKSVLEEIDKSLQKWIRKISGPTTDEELEYLLSNGHKKRLCDKFPMGKYQYKVFLKYKIPEEKRRQFVEWCANYQDKLKISKTSQRWLEGNKFYVQDPFMYVEDERMLSMIGMFLGGHIKKVEHFILRTSALAA